VYIIHSHHSLCFARYRQKATMLLQAASGHAWPRSATFMSRRVVVLTLPKCHCLLGKAPVVGDRSKGYTIAYLP
jgi:hypothetical protein